MLKQPFADELPTLAAVIARLEARESIPQIEVAVGDDAAAMVLRHVEPLSAADRRDVLDVAMLGGPSTVGPDHAESMRLVDEQTSVIRRQLRSVFGQRRNAPGGGEHAVRHHQRTLPCPDLPA